MKVKYQHTVLIACTFAFFATMFPRLGISPLVPEIAAEFDTSNARIGVALTGMWMAYSLMQFPSGALSDQYGERLIIVVSLGGTVLASLLIVVSPVFGLFTAALVILGIFTGFHYTVGTALLTRQYDEMGRTIGIHDAGATIAGLAAPVTVAWVSLYYNWRAGVLIAGVLALFVFIAFSLFIRPTEPQNPDKRLLTKFRIQPMTSFLLQPKILFTTSLAIGITFIWQGTASFLPTFFVQHHKFSQTHAGIIFSAYFIIQSVGQIGIGSLSDRYGHDMAIMMCIIFSGIGFVLLIMQTTFVGLVVGVFFIGIGMSVYPPLISRYLNQLSNERMGAELGLVRTVYGVLGATGPLGIGWVADLAGWGVSFSIFIVLSVLVAAAIILNTVFNFGY